MRRSLTAASRRAAWLATGLPILALSILAAPVAPVRAQDAAQDPVAAVVNGTEIRRSELQSFIQTLPEQYRQYPLEMVYQPVLDRVIDGVLLTAKAEKEGLADDAAVKVAMEEARKAVLRDQLLRKTFEAAGTDAALAAAYEEEKKRPDFSFQEVRARHILVKTKEEADKILADLAAGKTFEELAKASSQDPGSKDQGGELGWFRKEAMVAPFAEAAFAQEPGTVAKAPVQTEFGWHVIEVEEKRTTTPSLEEMRPQLMQVVGRKAIDQLIADARQGAKIERFAYDGQPVPPGEATPAPAPEPAPSAN